MRLISLLSQLLRSKRVLRFLISGGTALAVNLALLYLFVDILHIWYITGSVAAFIGAFMVSFTLQKFWTFDNRTLDALHVQVGLSLVVAVGNLLFNTLIMYILVDHFSVYHLFAQTIASGVIACESFFLYKYVVFVARIKESSISESPPDVIL